MGTVLELTLVGRDPGRVREQLDAAFADVARLESLLTRFDSESPLSRLNRDAGQGPQRVDPILADVLRRSVEAARTTRGCFDVTIGPLIDLWMRAAREDEPPSAEDVEAARRLVDATRIRADADGEAELPDVGMSVDLGGIAKGYALDRIVEQWRRAGTAAALLSFGQSSVWALGAAPGDVGWRLALRDAAGELSGTVTLRDQAFSVSNSLGQWSEIGGRRYGHVIDPRNGLPLDRGAQVVVVAPDATTAEVLSTALLVLGPREGMQLVESLPGVEARMLLESGVARRSRGWLEASRYESLADPIPTDASGARP